MEPDANAPKSEPERVDDPDLEAALDEPADQDGDEVLDALDAMICAIGRAVA